MASVQSGKVRVPIGKRCWDPSEFRVPKLFAGNHGDSTQARHPATHRGTGKGICSVGQAGVPGGPLGGPPEGHVGVEQRRKGGAGQGWCRGLPPELQGEGSRAVHAVFKEALVSALEDPGWLRVTAFGSLPEAPGTGGRPGQ